MASHRGATILTFAEVQLLSEALIGCQALCHHMRNEHKLLQSGGVLLLLPAGGDRGMQTRDQYSTGNDAVQAAAHLDINSCGNKEEN